MDNSMVRLAGIITSTEIGIEKEECIGHIR
jgi:hypothetical protein